MKKTTTSLESLREQLRAIERELDLDAHVARACDRESDDVELAIRTARLELSEPRAAAARGRGERVEIDVFTVWNEPPFRASNEPLDVVRRRVASLEGVEDVGVASVDTQLQLIWSFPVTLRVSQ